MPIDVRHRNVDCMTLDVLDGGDFAFQAPVEDRFHLHPTKNPYTNYPDLVVVELSLKNDITSPEREFIPIDLARSTVTEARRVSFQCIEIESIQSLCDRNWYIFTGNDFPVVTWPRCWRVTFVARHAHCFDRTMEFGLWHEVRAYPHVGVALLK